MKYFRTIWLKLQSNINEAILRYGTHRFMLYALATLALLDAFVPMTANTLVVIMAILQPLRNKLTIVMFAISAGLSSLIFAFILSHFSESADLLGLQTFGEHWETAQNVLAQTGPWLLIPLSIFPDIPRPSIALISLSGVQPHWIGLMVFMGKLVLYSGIIILVNKIPNYLSQKRDTTSKFGQWLQVKARRFQAYRRRLVYLVRINEERNTNEI